MPTERAHGIQIAKMCEAFVEEGMELELVVPRRRTHAADAAHFYGLRHPLQVRKLPVLDVYGWGRIGYIIGTLSFMLAYFWYCIPKRFSEKQAIIYTTDIDQFFFFFIPLLGIPYFVEMHDAKKKIWRWQFFLSGARGIIAINSIIKKELQEVFKMTDDKIIIQPNGVDEQLFKMEPNARGKARRRLGISQEEKIALYVGRIYPWKELGIVAEAAYFLRDVTFYIIGDLVEQFKQVTGISAVPANVICAGSKKFQEIPLWLAAADVLLVCGTKRNEYSYYHTSPMKLFEYMAAAPHRAIVASDTPANREILSDDEAIFYEADNPRDLAKNIRYAFDFSADAHARSARAHQKVFTHYTWNKRAGHIIEFMNKDL